MASDEGRVAVVTGGAGGLGPACCESLALIGMRVVVTDIDGLAASAVAKRLTEHGFGASSAALDVTDPDAVEQAVAKTVDAFGRLDALVNLAGVLRNDTLAKLRDEDFRLTVDTHLFGAMHTMRAAAPRMVSAGYGRIVNASSVGARGAFGGSAYASAKGGIEALTRTAAIELGRKGITVNAVAPGMINSGMFTTVPEDYQRERIARTALGRAGEPYEVGACVAFLASEAASYVTGQVLYVCGGSSVGI
jgi:3-oxoacyl-[acyl-carrier protein] reductase